MDKRAHRRHIGDTQGSFEQARAVKEVAMWQLHAAFRFGDYRTPELDVTPALGIGLIVTVFALIVHTGL